MNKVSAGVVVVRCRPEGVKYLLLRVYRYWDFPKGEVEPGEDPLAAARREVLEETGLDNLHFTWGLGYCETPAYGAGKVARYYLAESPEGEVRLGVSPELGRPEHHEYRWFSAIQADRHLNDRVREVLHWAMGYIEQRGDKAHETPSPSGRGLG